MNLLFLSEYDAFIHNNNNNNNDESNTLVICVILSRHTLLSPAAPRPSVSQAEIEMHLIYWSEYMAAG